MAFQLVFYESLIFTFLYYFVLFKFFNLWFIYFWIIQTLSPMTSFIHLNIFAPLLRFIPLLLSWIISYSQCLIFSLCKLYHLKYLFQNLEFSSRFCYYSLDFKRDFHSFDKIEVVSFQLTSFLLPKLKLIVKHPFLCLLLFYAF